MEKKQNLHQIAADRTRSKILEAARLLFSARGFSGTSMGALAKEAGVNQSLLYHYFENKEALWRQVKIGLVSTEIKLPVVNSLEDLLNTLILDRLRLYLDQPDLARMVLWQSLEADSSHIVGLSKQWIEFWVSKIEGLQKAKAMRSDFTPQEVIALCNGVIWTPLLARPHVELNVDAKTFCNKMLSLLLSHFQI